MRKGLCLSGRIPILNMTFSTATPSQQTVGCLLPGQELPWKTMKNKPLHNYHVISKTWKSLGVPESPAGPAMMGSFPHGFPVVKDLPSQKLSQKLSSQVFKCLTCGMSTMVLSLILIDLLDFLKAKTLAAPHGPGVQAPTWAFSQARVRATHSRLMEEMRISRG